MYLWRTERTLGAFDPSRGLEPVVKVRQEFQDFMGPLEATGGDLWVVLGVARISGKGLRELLPQNAPLVREFQRLDIKFIPLQQAPGSLRFRQPLDELALRTRAIGEQLSGGASGQPAHRSAAFRSGSGSWIRVALAWRTANARLPTAVQSESPS